MKYLLVICLAFLSCENIQLITTVPEPTTEQEQNKELKKPTYPTFDLGGHSGASALMPRNTIPSFIKALELGVNTIEMDIAITKDLKPIISHDGFFLSGLTIKPDGKVVTKEEEKSPSNFIYRMDYEQVKKYDVGTLGSPYLPELRKFKVAPPLLSDVIDSAEVYCKTAKRPLPFYNIEIKSYKVFDNIFYPPVEQYVDLVMGVIRQKNITERVIIASNDMRPLQYMHNKYPNIRLALYGNSSDKIPFDKRIEQLGFVPNIFGINYQGVDSALIQAAAAKGVKVLAFTVNEVSDMKRMKELGVYGILTDCPNRAKNL